jgi:plasmid stabilization system protein ParE
MPEVRLTTEARAQLERLRKFHDDRDEAIGLRAIRAIIDALRPLARFPAIGRPVRDHRDLREISIRFGRSGYVALYRFDPEADAVVILTIRHQKEAGYSDFE